MYVPFPPTALLYPDHSNIGNSTSQAQVLPLINPAIGVDRATPTLFNIPPVQMSQSLQVSTNILETIPEGSGPHIGLMSQTALQSRSISSLPYLVVSIVPHAPPCHVLDENDTSWVSIHSPLLIMLEDHRAATDFTAVETGTRIDASVSRIRVLLARSRGTNLVGSDPSIVNIRTYWKMERQRCRTHE